jgi:hypothetical protein
MRNKEEYRVKAKEEKERQAEEYRIKEDVEK